jgi:hypothetical protein
MLPPPEAPVHAIVIRDLLFWGIAFEKVVTQ